MPNLKLFGAAAMGALVIIGTASQACATLITFDDLINFSTIPNGYAGFDWDAFDVLDGPAYCVGCGYANGTVSPNNVAYAAAGGPSSFSSASAFTLNSFYLTSAWNDGLNIKIDGYLGAVQQYTTTVVVNTTGPTLFTLNWSGIDNVHFDSPNAQGGIYIALDNVLVNAPTPLPATLPLFATGLVALGLIGRRRKQKAHAAV